MRLSPRVAVPFTVALLALRCGDNIESPGSGGTFGPPQNVKAASINSSTIRLDWSPATASSDSTFRGYIVQWGSRADTVPKISFSMTIDSLGRGQTLFSLYSLRTTGQLSDPALIRWAPAARFDSAIVVFENNTATSTREEGVNVGTRTTNPSAMVIEPADPAVVQRMDLYFYGGRGPIRDSLAMWSASLFVGILNQTRFSTVMHAATSLDFAIGSFPDPGTFTKDSIAVVDNTIYYARVIGEPQEVNYCRIHLHVRPMSIFPNRIIEVRISLQRVPGLLFAGPIDRPRRLRNLASLFAIGNTYH